jgi:hypothetical protein
MAIMFAIGGHSASAQLVCSDEVYVVPNYNVLDEHGKPTCCTVTVQTCREWVGGVFEITFGKVVLGEGCATLSDDMPWIRREVNRKAIGRFSPEPIPDCPATTTVMIRTKWSPCYRWVGGEALPCGAANCIRTCRVCYMPDETPCNPEGKRLSYVGCSTSEGACPTTTGSCSVNVCESE